MNEFQRAEEKPEEYHWAIKIWWRLAHGPFAGAMSERGIQLPYVRGERAVKALHRFLGTIQSDIVENLTDVHIRLENF
jgi:hypothetical protein